MARPSKIKYYLNIAKEVAERSTCCSMKSGAIIVKNDQIVATGYNGAPRKTLDCLERGNCIRREKKIPSGQRYELCRSVHAEQNAIINSARAGVSLLEGDMYLYGMRIFNGTSEPIDIFPCFICKKMIINSGLKRVICITKEGEPKMYEVEDWIEEWSRNDMLDDKETYQVEYRE